MQRNADENGNEEKNMYKIYEWKHKMPKKRKSKEKNRRQKKWMSKIKIIPLKTVSSDERDFFAILCICSLHESNI